MNIYEFDLFCNEILKTISTRKRQGKDQLITETDFTFPDDLRSFLEGRGYQVIDLGAGVRFHQTMIHWVDRRSNCQH